MADLTSNGCTTISTLSGIDKHTWMETQRAWMLIRDNFLQATKCRFGIATGSLHIKIGRAVAIPAPISDGFSWPALKGTNLGLIKYNHGRDAGVGWCLDAGTPIKPGTHMTIYPCDWNVQGHQLWKLVTSEKSYDALNDVGSQNFQIVMNPEKPSAFVRQNSQKSAKSMPVRRTFPHSLIRLCRKPQSKRVKESKGGRKKYARNHAKRNSWR